MIKEFLINGEFTHFTKNTYKVFAPANLEELAEIPDANEEDVLHAVAAAKEAYYREWKNFDPEKRERLFWKWAELLEDRAEEIGQVAGAEAGRSSRALASVVKSRAGMIRYYAGFITKNYGDVLELSHSYLNYVVKEPLGVVAAMVPWNSAVPGAIQKIAPALAAGNTVVLRCADEAPLATLMLGQTLHEAGFPRGVINVIAGNGPASGRALVDHPDVRLISFTGSVTVEKLIMEAAAKAVKRTVLELGGKSPFVVFADSNLELAARKAVECGFIYQGQMCCAVTRVVVESSTKEDFNDLLVKYIAEYEPAYPDEEGSRPTIGPLFNEKQLAQVEKYVELGRQEGRLLTGGQRITSGKFGQAYYYQPTVFEFENDQSSVCQEEIFGPVLSVVPFKTIDEAINIANNVRYGLSASVWSKNLETLNQLIQGLEAGTIWANSYNQFSNHSPWGGVKESGVGREYGKYALEPYYEYKNVWLNA